MKKIIFILLSVIIVLSCTSCDKLNNKMVSDIAYNRTHNETLVYIKENNQYIPFLVLTDDYNSNTLLLRKEVLDKPRGINEYISFYKNSEIDQYLNDEYLQSLLNIEKYIAVSDVEVTDEEALGKSGDETITIQRKVFLLSCNEVDINFSVNIASEGKELDYFKNEDNRKAYNNGTPVSWWLRTPNTYYLSCTYIVGDNNKIGYTNAYDNNGIRPAFCIRSDSPIELKRGIVNNQSVYVLQ